jgi:hypothetical protein
LLHVTRVPAPAGSKVNSPVDFISNSGKDNEYSMRRFGSTRVNSIAPVPSLSLSHDQRAPWPKGGPE